MRQRNLNDVFHPTIRSCNPRFCRQIRDGNDAAEAVDEFLSEGDFDCTLQLKGEDLPIAIANFKRLSTQTHVDFGMIARYSASYAGSMALSGRSVPTFNPTAVADIMIGAEEYFLVAAANPRGDASLCIGSRNDHNDIRATLDFAAKEGMLHIYRTITGKDYRHKGFSTVLLRLAHLISGQPRKLKAHRIIDTNPLYQVIAEEYLNSGHTKLFAPEELQLFSAMMGIPIAELEVSNPQDIKIRVSRDFEMTVDPRSKFDLEITLWTSAQGLHR
jgi:hypothetical protein